MNLKIILLLIFLLTFNSFVFSQKFERTDSIVKNYPANFNSLNDLTSKINLDFDNQIDKTRAVFYWISNNISYDIEFSKILENNKINAFSYKNEKEKLEKEKKFISDLAINTFKSQKAICFGYSALFYILCNKLNIESKVIKGDLKSNPLQIGKEIQINHAWNIVKLNDKWEYIDCTLAAGNISSKTDEFIFKFNDAFFLTSPELFYLNHFPENKNILLLKSEKEYCQLPIFFPEYFKSEFKVLNPTNGILKRNDDLIITFDNNEIQNYSIELYLFNEKKYLELENLQNSNSFKINLNGINEDYIILYVNRKPFICYKIQ